MKTQSIPQSPLPVLVAGIGGFASSHHQSLRLLEEEGLCKVIAACDPGVDRLSDVIEKHSIYERGVKVYSSFEEMIERHGKQAAMVSVAAPIHFHTQMHAACVERGLACYMEKPPTLDPSEMQVMLKHEKQARYSTNVGFNFQVEPARQALKQRLLDGEFGTLQKVHFYGLSRRTPAYFERSSWAGRLRMGEKLVLDSCCGNACSHHLHDLMHWAGTGGMTSYAMPMQVTAELYRANHIEGTDTVFASVETDSGVRLRLAVSHACQERDLRMERLVGTSATVEITYGSGYQILTKDGVTESGDWKKEYLLPANLRDYLLYLLGQRKRPLISLEDCVPFVHLNALLYTAAPAIHTISSDDYEILETENGQIPYRAIRGVETASRRFLDTGEFPAEQKIRWAQEGGVADPSSLAHLNQKIEMMSRHSPFNVPAEAATGRTPEHV